VTDELTTRPTRRNRKRLRTRIILSVLAIGTLLSLLFGAFALLLRANLEERIIDRLLAKEVASYAEKYTTTKGVIEYSFITGNVFSDRKYLNVPAAWQGLEPGVHRLVEETAGSRTAYKLAIFRVPDKKLWFFLRYDVTAEERTRRAVTLSIIAAVLAFSGLALALGFYASSRVMSPVAELLRRLTRLSRKGKVEPLAPHFADDEVGQLAQALDDYAHKLTELVERDREFNSDVSHELRTPLAVIQSTTELMLGMPNLPDKARERLARIERSSKQSTELITALLHLSRGEKQAPNDGEHTDVSRLIGQIVENNRYHLIGRPVQVDLDASHTLEVAAAESVIAVVLGNLIGNAFKYTREGSVRVVVHKDRVTVEDTGPGIPEAEREQVFERHFRGSTGGGSGAGLGLSIVRRLCALYGWEVELEPRLPHGIKAVWKV
jgi:signal transduction histidine kinase